jgi:hypothetical protein
MESFPSPPSRSAVCGPGFIVVEEPFLRLPSGLNPEGGKPPKFEDSLSSPAPPKIDANMEPLKLFPSAIVSFPSPP